VGDGRSTKNPDHHHHHPHHTHPHNNPTPPCEPQTVAPGPYGGGFAQGPRAPPPGNHAARIYVGSIAFEVPVDVVKRLFESFGPIRSCTLLPDPNNPSRVRPLACLLACLRVLLACRMVAWSVGWLVGWSPWMQ
jgi:hypothetical protein